MPFCGFDKKILEAVAGHIDTKETPLGAARRELKEETGNFPIRIKNFKIKGRYPYSKELSDRKGIYGQTFTLFSAEIKKTKKIKIDKKEHLSFEWCSFEKALKKLTYSDQKKCLKIVNKWIKENDW